MALADHPFTDRFMDRVQVREDGCWEWVGYRDSRYGRFYAGDRAESWAHRNAYLMEHGAGSIPPGMHVDHLCRFTFCVNPAHLEVVTPAENLRRAVEARPKPACGTSAAYWRGCRCDACRETVNTGRSARNRERLASGQYAHGQAGYAIGCRCETCRRAATAATMRSRRKAGVKPFREARHGTIARYTSSAHNCRCDACRAAWAAHQRAYRARKVAERAA